MLNEVLNTKLHSTPLRRPITNCKKVPQLCRQACSWAAGCGSGSLAGAVCGSAGRVLGSVRERAGAGVRLSFLFCPSTIDSRDNENCSSLEKSIRLSTSNLYCSNKVFEHLKIRFELYKFENSKIRNLKIRFKNCNFK